MIVSQQEFADILGVDRTTVAHAIRTKRLETSIVKKGARKNIKVYDGCIEWYLKKNFEKGRFSPPDPKNIQQSKARSEFYKSLIKELEYKVMTGKCVPVDEVSIKGSAICLNARRYLEERRDQDALILPTFKDDFETRKLLRERDNGFLVRLSKLAQVGTDVARETMEKYKDKVSVEDFGENHDDE